MQRSAPRPRPRLTARAWLWAEFALLFVAVPVAMAAFFGLYPLFGALFVVSVAAVVLLALTPGFRPRDLLRGPVLGEWRLILGFTLVAAAVLTALALALVPGRFLSMPQYNPDLWIRIMLFYPLVSALPQELVFRSLFFHRYGRLFPDPRVALAVNAVAFAFAHLFYQNPVAIGLTLIGGFVFGWAYMRHGSLILAVVLHAIAGQLVFTSGLGIYFYHGAIGTAP